MHPDRGDSIATLESYELAFGFPHSARLLNATRKGGGRFAWSKANGFGQRRDTSMGDRKTDYV
ncbi:MAG TPA: hypothetical protein VKZ53_20025 [Candidatus Angelobacter sp.]|nr:hypothetical protein [Candidatus Angelobacter sp.]